MSSKSEDSVLLPQALATELHGAATMRRPIPADSVPEGLSVAEAYRVQSALDHIARQGGRVRAGWKIGFTSPAAQARYCAPGPMIGTIYADSMRTDGCRIPLAELIDPRIEGEILLEIGEPPAPDADDEALVASIAAVSAAFEIADSRIFGWANHVIPAIADNACCGLVIRGEGSLNPARLDFVNAECALLEDGRVIATGAARDCLGSILSVYRWLLAEAPRLGLGVRKGDIVLCGAMAGPELLLPGRSYQLRVTGLRDVTCGTDGDSQ